MLSTFPVNPKRRMGSSGKLQTGKGSPRVYRCQLGDEAEAPGGAQMEAGATRGKGVLHPDLSGKAWVMPSGTPFSSGQKTALAGLAHGCEGLGQLFLQQKL